MSAWPARDGFGAADNRKGDAKNDESEVRKTRVKIALMLSSGIRRGLGYCLSEIRGGLECAARHPHSTAGPPKTVASMASRQWRELSGAAEGSRHLPLSLKENNKGANGMTLVQPGLWAWSVRRIRREKGIGTGTHDVGSTPTHVPSDRC